MRVEKEGYGVPFHPPLAQNLKPSLESDDQIIYVKNLVMACALPGLRDQTVQRAMLLRTGF